MKDGKRCFYNQVEKEAGREDRIRSGLMKVPKDRSTSAHPCARNRGQWVGGGVDVSCR